jgi:hypothetical protein
VRPSSSEGLNLFPTRKSRLVFIARGLALVIMSGALALYDLGQFAKPTVAPVTDSTSLPAGLLTLTEDVKVVSPDGLAILDLPTGTKVLDAQGQPPASITVTAKELPFRTDIAVVGLGYEFGPDGITLDPPVSLTVSYDPKAYWPFAFQDVNCGQFHMAWVSSSGAPVSPWLEVIADLNAHIVTTEIDHFGTVMLFCEVFGSPIS